jgi:glycosyltransferase involved in cell wall biosynthesis
LKYDFHSGELLSASSLKLSIITPCLNRAGFIADAIESVLRQDETEAEHIVMDGGSTDGTLEVLKNYPHLRVFSQPDEGIYDALNKGVHLADGDVIGFLNSDDLYEARIFSHIMRIFQDHPGIAALSGGASIFQRGPEGEWVRLAAFPGISPGELLPRSTLGAPVFNAWFFRRSLVERLDGFENRYRFVADRDFLIRLAFLGVPYTCVDGNLYQYRMHPGSFTLSGQDSGEDPYVFECRDLARRYFVESKVPREERRIFRNWHSQLCLDQLMTAWHRRAYRRMASYMVSGTRLDPAWPLLFGRKFVERLPYMTNIIKDR